MGMNTLVEMTFGSHLYGTAGPNSDTDFKGVYKPSRRELLLSRFPKSVNASTKKDSTVKNTAADTDKEFYSLHYFLDLACKGETVALDMLHAPRGAWLVASEEWYTLHNMRSLFYTKNLKSLVGYARKQAAKYGVKGSRLAEAKSVLDVLRTVDSCDSIVKVSDLLTKLPVGEHTGLRTVDGAQFYDMCGKKFTLNAKAVHYIPMVEKFISEYGARAREAENNAGIDWKAVSHAFRAAFQVKAILTEGDFTYPLRETDYLRLVKGGTLNFLKDVTPTLDALMDEVETLSANSTLPDEVDRDKVDELLLVLLQEKEYYG
jgi:hypothetical protein